MLNIEIRRPTNDDIEQLKQFFRSVVTDTFYKEGIGNMVEDLEDEIECKINYLIDDLQSSGETRYFLIAVKEERIVGTIEYGAASELINPCTNNALKDVYEVGTVFVDPEYQRNGIANLLLHSIYTRLKNKGIKECCLDSGYGRSQKIWQQKYGTPDYFLKNYWGEGNHHMIWRLKVEELVR
ncbi:GNAT family N-acetyltransferase [Rossellomorea vietnamensis]|uniref:GNAT family N-acetyltransferase n=1 Tax=Rossellomorea vietnamensis TaxID=218284 RepID=A0A5D4NRR2_9BACI|nr:GNAT family N-acetyltransferase [Rossellomorea vietnamensis]TYS16569.1 GNAT family N-acetyltransferase [Rossellomorea vietnamensis]